MKTAKALERVYMRECRKIVRCKIKSRMKQAAKGGYDGVLFEGGEFSPNYYDGIEKLIKPRGYELIRLTVGEYSKKEEIPENRYGRTWVKQTIYHGWLPLGAPRAYYAYVPKGPNDAVYACFIRLASKEGEKSNTAN